MGYRVEDLISKCVEGHAAREVVRGVEEELPDAQTVKLHLMSDLKSHGFNVKTCDISMESTCIKVSVDEEIVEERRSNLMLICDTYARTYPEFEVLIATK